MCRILEDTEIHKVLDELTLGETTRVPMEKKHNIAGGYIKINYTFDR